MIKIRKQFTILFDGTLITQPNQAFTPRQILEQFARNEIVPSYNQSTDTLSDDNFKEDDLLDGDVMEFDDNMEAESYVKENQFKPYEEKQTPIDGGEGSSPASAQADSGTQPAAAQAQE